MEENNRDEILFGTGKPNRSNESSLCGVMKSLDNLKILVVDDDITNLLLLEIIFKLRNIIITTSLNAHDALEEYSKSDFDFILTDVGLPGTDGIQLTKEIRKLESVNGRHSIMIAITGRTDSDDRKQCLSSGMDFYITKPINEQELFDIIESNL